MKLNIYIYFLGNVKIFWNRNYFCLIYLNILISQNVMSVMYNIEYVFNNEKKKKLMWNIKR